MSWLNFLAPGWALMGLIAVPIILLYLLRQKRPDQKVSSTLLWSKTLADLRASTPFQKLRRNLLLLLQLLILAALVLTLMRPVIQARASSGQAGVIVIDATASMQTHDDGASESRLDRAKIEAKKLVDRMRPGDQFMLIADGGGMSQSHQVNSGFTSSKSELNSLIESIRPSDTPSDLSESLLIAATNLRAKGAPAGGDTAKSGTLALGQIWLLSDGSNIHIPDAVGQVGAGAGGGGGGLQFVRIGSSDHSVGITRVSVTLVPKEERTYEVFVGFKNDWPVEKRVAVLLAYGTKDAFLPNQAKFATLPPNGSGSAVFEEVVSDPGKLFVRVDDTDDDFPLDNTGYAIIAPPRKTRVVLVSTGNEFLERMLATASKVGLADCQVLAPQFYKPDLAADLVILDGFLPPNDQLPAADTLLIAPQIRMPGGSGGDAAKVDVAGFHVAATIDRPVILRWKREDPLMNAIQDLGDLYVGHALLMDHDNAAIELVSAPEGPLIAYKDFGAVRRYFVSFSPLLESNWHRLPSLIMFLQNVIEQTGVRHFIGTPQMIASGTPARLWSPVPEAPGGAAHETNIRVTLPDESVMDVPVHEGAADFGATDQLGFYEAAWPDGKKTLFAVNLLSPAESDIRPQSVQAPGGGKIEEHENVTVENREIWRWLAVAALCILMLEWWVYHRRIA